MDSQTIHTLFENQVTLHPGRIALRFKEESLTFKQLNEKANQLAHYLLSQGVKKDRPIAFCLERSMECLITMLAILKAGGGYLPLDPLHPVTRLLSLLQ